MLPKQMEQNILKSVVGENAQQVKEKKENEVVTTFTTSNFLILNEQNQNTTSKCLETPDSWHQFPKHCLYHSQQFKDKFNCGATPESQAIHEMASRWPFDEEVAFKAISDYS